MIKLLFKLLVFLNDIFVFAYMSVNLNNNMSLYFQLTWKYQNSSFLQLDFSPQRKREASKSPKNGQKFWILVLSRACNEISKCPPPPSPPPMQEFHISEHIQWILSTPAGNAITNATISFLENTWESKVFILLISIFFSWKIYEIRVLRDQMLSMCASQLGCLNFNYKSHHLQ